MKYALSLLTCLFAAVAQAQSITVPAVVNVDTPGLVIVRATAVDADAVRYFVIGKGLQTIPPDVLETPPGVFLGFAMSEGTYKIGVICAKSVNGKALLSVPHGITIVVGAPAPPTPPVPPSPPTPPTPPAPIPDAGLHVLLIYQQDKDMPSAQQAVVYGKEFRDTLEATCALEADGKTKAYRIFDAKTDVSKDYKTWVDAFARPHPTLPWIVVSNGASGYEGPLPATVAEAQALIAKFAK